jgi:ABC-type molybdenum transport system ATPase subunit/photorepair protein PhrA
MCLREIRFHNVRLIRDIAWSVPESKAAGWHVIVVDNVSGKSSFLRSIALALFGPKEASSLLQSRDDWPRGTA